MGDFLHSLRRYRGSVGGGRRYTQIEEEMRQEDFLIITDAGGSYPSIETPQGFFQPNEPVGNEVTYALITSDQHNFQLGAAFIHILTTSASWMITGFVGVGTGLKMILNGGANDLVLANDNAGSSDASRILAHSGANITLTPNQIALIFYDRTTMRVRAGRV